MTTREQFWDEIGLTVDDGLEATMRDGVTLRATGYRPQGNGPYPVLLVRTAYDRRMSAFNHWQVPELARRGFFVVVQDIRGRYGSDGTFVPFLNEARDGHDTIEWAARLPAANGQVVTFGASYNGFLQVLAAAEQPPSLCGICPDVPGASLVEGWLTSGGGNPQLPMLAVWTAALGLDRAERAGDAEAAATFTRWLEDPAELVGDPGRLRAEPFTTHTPWLIEWLDDLPGSPWGELSLVALAPRIRVPVLLTSGWFDIFGAGTLALDAALRAADVPVRLVAGPWTHGPNAMRVGALDVPAAAVDVVHRAFEESVAAMLGDAPFATGVEAYAMVADRWIRSDRWPPPGETAMTLHLASPGRADGFTAAGRLDGEPSDTGAAVDFLDVDSVLRPTTIGGRGLAPVEAGAQDVTDHEHAGLSLVYRSQPLEDDVLLAGPAELHAWLSCPTPTAQVVARLVLADGGTRVLLGEEIVRITGGAAQEYVIRIADLAALIPRGASLHLHLAAGSVPMWEPDPQNGGPFASAGGTDAPAFSEIAVWHDTTRPTRLELRTGEDAEPAAR